MLASRSCRPLTNRGQAGHNVTMEYAGYIEQYSDQIRYMHMPMLAQLPTGTLMAAWQASPLVIDDLQEHDRLAVEGLDLQHIRLSHSKDKEGYAWTPSKRVPIPQEAALWSPVLHVDTDGRTWLFYSESVGCRKSYICNQCTPRIRHPCHPRPLQETEVCHSDPALWTPGGHIKVITSENPLAAEPKWSPPRLLLSANSGGGIPKVICNRIVVLSTGEWLLPYWREQTTGAVVDGTCKKHEKGEIEVEVMIDGQPAKELKQLPPGSDCYASQQSPCNTGAREYSGVLRSPDGGQTWKARGQVMLPNTNLIEGTLAELRNGTVLMVFRTQIGCLYKSLSHDKGMTWSRARPMNVPNPNSKVHLMRLEPSGHLLLAFNNHRGANTYRGLKNCRGCRSKLHLAMSIDDGESWRHIVSLDDELSSSAIRIHYPCMLQLGRDQRLMITYSRFYLGRKMGLTSPDQGVVVMRLNLKRVLDNLRAVFAPPSAS
uniref:Bnr asp-box repeat protein n=1 Tax=Tetraselmis sp. GSL018 TaxID=582737 RepID=A0A061RT54_9CHLO